MEGFASAYCAGVRRSFPSFCTTGWPRMRACLLKCKESDNQPSTMVWSSTIYHIHRSEEAVKGRASKWWWQTNCEEIIPRNSSVKHNLPTTR